MRPNCSASAVLTRTQPATDGLGASASAGLPRAVPARSRIVATAEGRRGARRPRDDASGLPSAGSAWRRRRTRAQPVRSRSGRGGRSESSATLRARRGGSRGRGASPVGRSVAGVGAAGVARSVASARASASP